MLASVISLLITILIVAAIIYLVIWVLRDIIGLPLPEKVIQIMWVIFALVVLLYLVQMFVGGIAGGHFRLGLG